MAYPISDVARRIIYSGSAGVGPYSFSFEVLEQTDVAVYKNTTLLTLSADYTVTINVDGTGSITLISPAVAADDITLIGARAIERTSDFVTGGDLFANTLNDELDAQTIFAQQQQDEINRSMKMAPWTSTAFNTQLPDPLANHFLAFNATADGFQSTSGSELANLVAYANAFADTFVGDGSTTSWTLTRTPASLLNLDVSIDGVTQVPTTNYTTSGTTFTMTSAPPSGSVILVRYAEVLADSNGDSVNVRYTPAGTGAVDTNVQTKLRETVSVKDFGAVGDGVTDDTAAIQAASDAVGTGTLEFPDGDYLASFDTCANLVFTENTFVTGTVTITGASDVKVTSVRASCVKIETDVDSFVADLVYADGSYYTGASGLPGIYTVGVIDTVDISKLYVRNCGGTAQYNSATGFKGNGGSLLRIGYMESTDNAYDGFQYARFAGASAYAFERVVLGTLVISGCGNSTNPAGDNQHHGCYMSSARLLTFDKIIIRNQQRGFGIKFGSATASATGKIFGSVIDINGVTNGRGGIVFAEHIGDFQVATGRISNVDDEHVLFGGTVASGNFSFGSMSFIEESRTTTTQDSFLVSVNIKSLNVSGCTFNGWLDGSTRKGIRNAIVVAENVTVGSLISHGTKFNILAGTPYVANASAAGTGAIIENISIVAPTIDTCGGAIRIENGTSSASVLRGTITGIDAKLGSLTNAWILPRNALNVRDNRMQAGATFVRMNDMANARMSNVTSFDTTYWIDTATGVAIVPATYDTQYPEVDLSDGYIGKVYYLGAWKDFGAIV